MTNLRVIAIAWLAACVPAVMQAQRAQPRPRFAAVAAPASAARGAPAQQASYPQDPADSLYRTARGALNRGDYVRAAALFRDVVERYPRSAYAPDALYWRAFALSARDASSDDDLRDAIEALEMQLRRYPDAATHDDAAELAVRIRGKLAQRGDPDQAMRIRDIAGDRDKGDKGDKGDRRTSARGGSSCSGDDDDDMRIAALNALHQMNASQALPILREVLAKRDACSVGLRRKAVFIAAQTNTEEGGQLLLDAIRSDPDPEVRREAVFWLSEVPGERTVAVIDSILRNARDPEIQDKAIFALSQHKSARARQLLRGFAESERTPEELRGKAIFAIGHHSGTREDGSFLRELYPRLTSEQLKEQTIQAAAQVRGAEVGAWLLALATSRSEPTELRKKALFWGGQQVRAVDDLIKLYDVLPDQEMKEQLIWVLSDRREAAATDKLIEIARTDRNRELRKKAIFWLGQKNDPRVKQLLLEIINQ
ncbi:MAG: HEAT repeat domain-containing protein [Gemmatimonadaceae bacterium]